MKILIVEEELLLAEFMKTVLCEEGFETEWLSDGEEGAAYAETGTYASLCRQGTQVAALSVGDTSLNLLDSRLRCREKSVRLSAKEFDVMRYLMASPGQIISKEQILCRVWGFDSNAVENNVEVYVGLLRKKLRTRKKAVLGRKCKRASVRADTRRKQLMQPASSEAKWYWHSASAAPDASV